MRPNWERSRFAAGAGVNVIACDIGKDASEENVRRELRRDCDEEERDHRGAERRLRDGNRMASRYAGCAYVDQYLVVVVARVEVEVEVEVGVQVGVDALPAQVSPVMEGRRRIQEAMLGP